MRLPSLAALALVLTLAASSAWGDDPIRDQQNDYVAHSKDKARRWYHFGSQGPDDVFSNHDGHSNRLIPIYAFGRKVDLAAVTGLNSAYRDEAKVRKLYGFLPENTVNPDAEYADQSDLYRVQEAAVARGARQLIIVWFDGMDWETTRAAAIARSGTVYDAGKGSGLIFQEEKEGRPSQFGFFATSPTHDWKAADPDAQTPPRWLAGGYDAEIAGPNPWKTGPLASRAPGYLKGLDAFPRPPDDRDEVKAIRAAGRVPHAYTDSAPSAGEFATGVKSYNHGINVDEDGKPLPTLFNRLQEKGWKVGTATSVPFDHASPAAMYAHNAHRDDYQDLGRDMLGLSGIAQEKLKDGKEEKGKFAPHPGLDVVLGVGLGHEAKPEDLARLQGKNGVKGNQYLTDDDREKIDVRNGGKYVVAQRTAGVEGRASLKQAAEQAARGGKRLFGFYGGTDRDHLPYRTADGGFDPVHGIRARAETYTPADLRENPSLVDMTAAALTVLGSDPSRPFALFIEAGDVDFALHDNNLDNAIGAILDGEAAVRVVFDWVESHSNWDDAVVIVTSDHGHYLVLDDPRALAGHAR